MNRKLKVFIASFILTTCGKFTYSPYDINIKTYKVSDNNLKRILSNMTHQTKKKSNSFKIAIISDTHDYYDGLKKQVRYINAHHTQYDFVIITGDLSNVGLATEFMETKRRLDQLKLPYITTTGNHDLLIDGEKIYKIIFGEDTYSFSYKNTKFVLYNNNNWESSLNVPDLHWLKNELSSNFSQNLIVLSHIPPNDTDRFSKTEINFNRELINKYGVDYYINGHNHNHSNGFFGNAKHATVGSSSKGFLLNLKVSSIEVTHEFIKL